MRHAGKWFPVAKHDTLPNGGWIGGNIARAPRAALRRLRG